MPDLQDRVQDRPLTEGPTRMASFESRKRQEEETAQAVMGGFSAEAVAGAAGLVLAILALVIESSATHLAAIAAIALGAAFTLAGIAVAAKFNRLTRETGGTREDVAELGTGLTAELVGGVSVLVLGILALIQIVPVTLLSISAIVLGCTLLFGSATTDRLSQVGTLSAWVNPIAQQRTRKLASADAGLEILVGIAAVVLGILAVCGVGNPLVLGSIAFIAVGTQALISGLVVTGRMAMFLKH